MIVHYGYTDGSGKYYISIDTEKCNSCGECVEKCPQSVLEMKTMMIDIEEKIVVTVKEEHRKKIKYSCATCRQNKKELCVLACKQNAINII